MKKKPVNLDQLSKDGIAQIKTKRVLMNQGILTKENLKSHLYFNKVKCPITYAGPSMTPLLGKSLKVKTIHPDSNTVILWNTDQTKYWWWPLECIAR